MNISNRATFLSKDTSLEATRVLSDGSRELVDTQVIHEHFMDIYVNDMHLMEVVCTPQNLEDLVIGRLYTQKLIHGIEDIVNLSICPEGKEARVLLKQDIEIAPTKNREASCCTDNRSFYEVQGYVLEPLEDMGCSYEDIRRLIDDFSKDSKLHSSTGGTHSCYIQLESKEVVSFEDIGRHNAIDKAVGWALRQGCDCRKTKLYTTGRVPLDMVTKVIAAGIPVLITKAVPTKEAVGMAKEYGLILICRAWPDSFLIYSGEDKIKN